MKQIFLLIALTIVSSPLCAEETRIIFATDWKAQAEHGGFYQAVAKGFYKKRGLNVVIRPGGPQTDNPRLIAAGALDIAMASNNFQPLNLIAAGADVKVVMTTFQKDPQVLMVHPGVDATGFKDLKGMPIFLADSALATFWPWLQVRFGFENRHIRKYTYSLAPWLVNKNTVQEGYLSSEPFSAEQAGVKPKVFLFADEGYLGYAGMVMVRGEFLKENHEVVQAFVDASIDGWKDYLWNDPSAGNALILNDNQEMTQALLDFALAAMLKNKMFGNKASLGNMTADRWTNFYKEMSDLKVLPTGINASDAYTLEFLPQIRGEE